MQAQTSRPHVLERTTTKLCPIDLPALIQQNDLETFTAHSPASRPNAAEGQLDGASPPSRVGVTDDVRQGFVDGQDHGPAFRRGESEVLGEHRQRAAYDTEALWIASELHPQE